MKVLLINASVRSWGGGTDGTDRNRPVQAGPSYGLLSIASVLQADGHIVINLDPNIYDRWSAFVDHLRLLEADVVGVSSCSTTIFNDEYVIRGVREVMPDAAIVIGGYAATLRPRLLLEATEVDLLVAGEGEVAFRQIISVLERRRSGHPLGADEARELLSIPGVGVRYVRAGKECVAPPAGRYRLSPEEIESLPDPPWDIAPLDVYRSLWGCKYVNISTSRGCDHACPFCSIIDFHHRGLRLMSPKKVVELVARASQHVPDLDDVFFCDAHFTASAARVLEICRRIQAGKDAGGIRRNLTFGCEARVDTLTDELLDAMRSAGFNEVWLGLESGSNQVLGEYRKGQKVDCSRRAVASAANRGIAVIAFLMIASPRSVIDDVLATLDLAIYVLENGGDITPDVAYCQIAWEGTRLIERIREDDFDIGFSLGEFAQTHLADHHTTLRCVAEGGYVLPSDPVTRQLVLGAFRHAVHIGSLHTDSLLAGFFLSLREVFESFPEVGGPRRDQVRNLLWRSKQVAVKRRFNHWGVPFAALASLEDSLL